MLTAKAYLFLLSRNAKPTNCLHHFCVEPAIGLRRSDIKRNSNSIFILHAVSRLRDRPKNITHVSFLMRRTALSSIKPLANEMFLPLFEGTSDHLSTQQSGFFSQHFFIHQRFKSAFATLCLCDGDRQFLFPVYYGCLF